MPNQKLSYVDIAERLSLAPVTVSRIANTDNTFPKAVCIGRSKFIDSKAFYKWLSKKAGAVAVEGDYLLTAKGIQQRFGKSHTWVWQNVKAQTLPKPFKIGRNTFWLNSQIEALFTPEAA